MIHVHVYITIPNETQSFFLRFTFHVSRRKVCLRLQTAYGDEITRLKHSTSKALRVRQNLTVSGYGFEWVLCHQSIRQIEAMIPAEGARALVH